ncbi:MAG: hypothetical protein HZC10_05090 [Nitrospirae bacterium]|nr:hypothetical protein [Nitrospirota bacterium]
MLKKTKTVPNVRNEKGYHFMGRQIIKNVIYIVLIAIVSCSFNKELFPKKEFIETTEEAINALDAIEALLTNYDSSIKTKLDIDDAFKKLDIVLLKYRRYIKVEDAKKISKDVEKNSKQIKIVQAIGAAMMSLRLAQIELGLIRFERENKEHKNFNKAIEETQKARELFMQYKS